MLVGCHWSYKKKTAMLEERYALGSLSAVVANSAVVAKATMAKSAATMAKSARLRGKSFYQYPSRTPGRSSNEVLLKRSTPMTNDFCM